MVVGFIKYCDFGIEAAIRRGVTRVNLLFSLHVSVLNEISQSEYNFRSLLRTFTTPAHDAGECKFHYEVRVGGVGV